MIVVVVLAAMCVLPLSAQVKVGVEGGMNLSHYLVSGSDGYKAEQVGGMKPGFQLGVTVDYEIGKHWMLMSGLSWLQNRSTMKMMDHMVTYFPKTEIKMNKEDFTMTQVTKATMIGELLQIDQNIAPILLNIGMHCLGCPSSQMETIEEAAMVHGIDPDALVKEINDFLAKDLA